MATHNHAVDSTGADDSSQNGRGERPHQTFANVMRCPLHSSNLGSEFWSDALLCSAHLCNRTHHSAIDKTPHEAWTGKKPSLKHIKTFGSPVTAKETGARATKIDPDAFNGMFLRHTGTSRNTVCCDVHSGQVKTATHRDHDEHQCSTPMQHRTTAANHIIDISKDDKLEHRFGAKQLKRPTQIEMETQELKHKSDSTTNCTPAQLSTMMRSRDAVKSNAATGMKKRWMTTTSTNIFCKAHNQKTSHTPHTTPMRKRCNWNSHWTCLDHPQPFVHQSTRQKTSVLNSKMVKNHRQLHHASRTCRQTRCDTGGQDFNMEQLEQSMANMSTPLSNSETSFMNCKPRNDTTVTSQLHMRKFKTHTRLRAHCNHILTK